MFLVEIVIQLTVSKYVLSTFVRADRVLNFSILQKSSLLYSNIRNSEEYYGM